MLQGSPAPVLFHRTQKIGKIGNLSLLCQIGTLIQPFFMIYVTVSLDKGQVCLVRWHPRDSACCRVGEPPVRGTGNFPLR